MKKEIKAIITISDVSDGELIGFQLEDLIHKTDFYDKFNESILLDVANTLINDHSLGRAYTINKVVLESILSGLGIDINFNLELYYDYNGMKVPMPQIDNLFIDANSYPLITGITVNEVLEDIS